MTKKVSSGEAGEPASSAAMPPAMRLRSVSATGIAASIARLRGLGARAGFDLEELAQRRRHRRERRAAGGVAVRRHDARGVAEPAGDLVDEPRFARAPVSRAARRVGRRAWRTPSRTPR